MKKNFIQIKKVSKIYKNKFAALKNIDLNIQEGEIFALLGPNGAGKSTLINVLCGITYHSKGNIFIDGKDLTKNRKKIKSLIGLVPQELHLEAFETVFDNVNYSRGLWGKKKDDNYILNLLKKLNLDDKKYNLLMQLSGGMKRRVMVAKALVNNPELLILDEPTAGVDIELRRSLWDFLTEINENGTTIILTTHYLEEAERLCRNIAIIDSGEIVENTSMQELLTRLEVETFLFDLAEPLNEIPDNLDFQVELESPHKLKVTIDKEKGLNT